MQVHELTKLLLSLFTCVSVTFTVKTIPGEWTNMFDEILDHKEQFAFNKYTINIHSIHRDHRGGGGGGYGAMALPPF